MLQKQFLDIDAIRVPVKRAKTLDSEKVEALATDILEHGQITPIRVRKDGEKFVLVEGYHRLEAMRALGEEAVAAYIVHARLH
ncbi:MAG: ParB N-terminal domain-containing protein [Boseongicola sp.]|nr:ParB N-terminal domain-containing protein [Boseongicola sp.]NNJ67763.1 ParB N-terminal domain-containing protein [Boseongicola sp.]